MELPVLEARALTQRFSLPNGGRVCALDGVSLTLASGEILGLVGESGAGKSTLGRCFLGLQKPDAGELWFGGRPVDTPAAQKALRGAAGVIFQDPAAAMNPRMNLLEVVGEPLRIARAASGRALRERAAELLEAVGLDAGLLTRYPHELSGGQQQRACIARALARDPQWLLADEPFAALDASAAAQVQNLLCELRERRGLSCLLITHDLYAARHLCDRIAVLRAGKLVEIGETAALCTRPQHPYTRSLLAAAGIPSGGESDRS